jgi:hypothetical protein
VSWLDDEDGREIAVEGRAGQLEAAIAEFNALLDDDIA